jgi:HlyD family secretion protein
MNVPTFLRRSDPTLLLTSSEQPEGGPDIKANLRLANIALAAFVCIFGAWSMLAPLDSAAIASGMLRADGGGRRTVQHLEGGIVRELLVKEGQLVKAGQPLALLDNIQSGAQDSALRSTFDTLLAQDARLTAERLGLQSVNYPDELTSRLKDPAVQSIIAASDVAFRARQRALTEQIAIMHQRLGQASADLGSTGAQRVALEEQRALVSEEAENVETLVNEGLERRSRLLALRRQAASLAGQQSQLTGNAGRVTDVMAETRAQIAYLRGQQASEAALQQREVQAALAETREKLRISTDVKARRQIVAPVAGRVVDLRIVTPGGVLAAGQPLLDLVPSNEQTVIVARLKANDIDVVNNGLVAEVRLTPYKARVMPMLRGTVRTVSADAIRDDKTNTIYYEAEILLDQKQLHQLKDVRLLSGMPAEVYIKLGTRSLFQYLTQPLQDSFQRAFRES